MKGNKLEYELYIFHEKKGILFPRSTQNVCQRVPAYK